MTFHEFWSFITLGCKIYRQKNFGSALMNDKFAVIMKTKKREET